MWKFLEIYMFIHIGPSKEKKILIYFYIVAPKTFSRFLEPK